MAEAVDEGRVRVEGVDAVRTESASAFRELLHSRESVPVAVDPEGSLLAPLQPDVVLDARMAKTNLGTNRSDAPFVVALGPGFTAGDDVHAVVETARGHDLGRVFWKGSARPDSNEPYPLDGISFARVLRAPCDGVLNATRPLGSLVKAGDVLAEVGGTPVVAEVGGLLRGMMRTGAAVPKGLKIGDIDPRGERVDPHLISDKARAIAGGVLEAILSHFAGGVRCRGGP